MVSNLVPQDEEREVLPSQQVSGIGPVSLMAAKGVPDTLPGVVREKERLGGGLLLLLVLLLVVVGLFVTGNLLASTVSMYEELLMCSSRWCSHWARDLWGREGGKGW